MQKELKPCPFCGGKPFVYTTGNVSCGFYVEIICENCGCRTDRAIEEVASDVWNARRPIEDIVEQLEYEKEKCEEDRTYWAEHSWRDDVVYNECDLNDTKADCFESAISIVKGV
jgi:Lar family restriction alleviation protein